MGDEVSGSTFTREQRMQYRAKVQTCLDVFERLLDDPQAFDSTGLTTGMEIELNLVDSAFQPAMKNTQVLEHLADPNYQTELGAFNIEFNVEPRELSGVGLLELEEALRDSLNHAEQKANDVGAHIVMVGILPTLLPQHLAGEWMSPSPRYTALNEAMLAARGEDIAIDITGDSGERLATFATSIAPEAACTSMQLHVQVSPSQFAPHWNAAQALLGPQTAVGANSPFFLGRQLWAETRTEVFTQATDTRPEELRNQGVRPRVFFGDQWVTSIFDLFEENVRYFPSLLPEITDEDPVAELAAGRMPKLQELRLHNGTVYRWNRPIVDTLSSTPHLRVENRVLPAGPTVVDTLANAAFYFGALRMMANDPRPVWSRMSFAAAHENFLSCARSGLRGTVYWPGLGECPADEVILRQLLPMAYQGLDEWGVAPQVRDRLLAVIEGRTKTGRTGAVWQTETVAAFERRGADRPTALTQMLELYCQGMHANEPVHTWQVPDQ